MLLSRRGWVVQRLLQQVLRQNSNHGNFLFTKHQCFQPTKGILFDSPCANETIHFSPRLVPFPNGDRRFRPTGQGADLTFGASQEEGSVGPKYRNYLARSWKVRDHVKGRAKTTFAINNWNSERSRFRGQIDGADKSAAGDGWRGIYIYVV